MTEAESEDLPAALKEQVVGMGEQGYARVEGAVLNRHGLQPCSSPLSTGRVSAVSHHWILALLLCLASACDKKIPERWAKLGMPSQDLHEVRDETNEDRFSADYRDCTPEQLTARVESALVAAGYKPACTQFEGRVRGYANGEDKLLVKVDSIGPVLALSVGNKQGADRLLYGICFEGYELGEPVRVK